MSLNLNHLNAVVKKKKNCAKTGIIIEIIAQFVGLKTGFKTTLNIIHIWTNLLTEKVF